VTSVAARLEAGEVLGRLGDPRFSGPYRLPEFIAIPGGRFWMGSDEAEVERLAQETGEDWFKRELPRHQVEVDAFALARYPTTNAMFACFVEDGGYGDERWWAEAIADGRWAGGKVRAWDGEFNLPRYWDDAGLNGPNQPVVGVTWYEALAYCRWLTAMLDDGHEYRLPAEAEWARAARGADGRRYPWGDEWQESKANTRAISLERTTPVGIFPDGASREGVLDLVGNVWEWCSTAYAEYPYDADDGREDLTGGASRVLRGGSAWNDRNLVRCASRYDDPPDNRDNHNGFRVARGPSR
jgi:formylglycine-generating enzyme required for sulfatase activity